MGKGKAPSQSSSSKKLEALQMETLQQQLDDAKKPVEIPKIEPVKPLPPPQIPNSGADAAAAEMEARKRALRRTNSGRGTLFAGETGFQRGAMGGGSTLLG
jgi:hypothetical protein